MSAYSVFMDHFEGDVFWLVVDGADPPPPPPNPFLSLAL